MTHSNTSYYDSLTILRSIADVDAVLSLLRRQADALRVRFALEAAARTINTCCQKVIGPLARTQTALAHADLTALQDGDCLDAHTLALVLLRLRETVRLLRGEADFGLAEA